jgi:hypothetical protein
MKTVATARTTGGDAKAEAFAAEMAAANATATHHEAKTP